jgi:hypothetical protein
MDVVKGSKNIWKNVVILFFFPIKDSDGNCSED